MIWFPQCFFFHNTACAQRIVGTKTGEGGSQCAAMLPCIVPCTARYVLGEIHKWLEVQLARGMEVRAG